MTLTTGSFDTLLLDMDGVVVDSVSALKSLYYLFLRRRGCVGSEDEFTGFNGRKLEEIVAAMKETYALPQSTAALLEEYRHDMFQVHETSTLVPGAHELLVYARQLGFRIGLVTSAARRSAETTLARLGIGSFFDALITGDQVQRAKPAPDLFLEAVAAFPGSTALAVDDSPLGIQAAQAAGIAAVHFASDGRREGIPQACEFSELLPLLARGFLCRHPIHAARNVRVTYDHVNCNGEEADHAWELDTARNRRLFNGPVALLQRLDISGTQASLSCASSNFKTLRYLRGSAATAWSVPVAVAVSGVSRSVTGLFLIGRRSRHVSSHGEQWELVPSGGLAPPHRPEEQLLTEFAEETTLPSSLVASVTSLGLVFDREASCLDACYLVNLRSDFPALDDVRVPSEYDELRAVTREELDVRARDSRDLVPTSRDIITHLLPQSDDAR